MTDELANLELRIARLLRGGVVLSGIFLAIGWAWQMATAMPDFAALHEYRQEGMFVSLNAALASGQWGLVICYVGLFILISLPLLRVLFTAVLLWKQHDRVLSSAAFLVFVVIIGSAVLGLEL